MTFKKTIFAEERCKGCGLCVGVCPKKIVKLSPDRLNEQGYSPAYVEDADQDRCIACAMCAKMCPDCVITVVKE